MPQVNQCISIFCNNAILSTLNANSGYSNIEMSKAVCSKTIFSIHQCLYQFIWLPFNFWITSKILQRMVRVILFTAMWQSAVVYLFNRLILLKSVGKQITHVRHKSTFLSYAGVTPTSRRRERFTYIIACLNHLMGPLHLKNATFMTNAIRKLNSSTSYMGLL